MTISDDPLVRPDETLRAWLKERERQGLDHHDEMWKGVLHLVPPASGDHQRLSGWLYRHLVEPAEVQGLVLSYETGVFAADNDYKVPDLVGARERHWSPRGVEIPELIIEILSPGDETLDKVPWYLEHGALEVVVIHRDSLDVQRWLETGPPDTGPFSFYTLYAGMGRVDGHLELRLPDVVRYPRSRQ